MSKLKYMDLFAGCGGLSDGFEKTGHFTGIAHVEWENAPSATLMKRLRHKWRYEDADRRVLRFDIQRTDELVNGWHGDPKFSSHIGLDRLVSESGGIDLIIGGPPCQAYSVAGRIRDEHGMHYDYRNYLFERYLQIVDSFRPKIVVFENVPGILSACPGGLPIVERVALAFRRVGYEITEAIRQEALIEFHNFGLPQKRSRVILLGLSTSYFKGNRQGILSFFYHNILRKRHANTVNTVAHAISDLPPLIPNRRDYRINGKLASHKPYVTGIPGHTPRYHNRRDIRIFRKLAYDIASGRNRFTSIPALKQIYTQETGKTSNLHKYHVLRWNEPSNTIPAHLYKDGLRHIHPDPTQARSITVREAARLQTFDDDFEFLGSSGELYKMIGNAVSPSFSYNLALAIHELIENSKGKPHA